MTLPPSILNLGAPANATPEVMRKLREEKARHAQLIEVSEGQRLRKVADYIEHHPESLEQAKAYVAKFRASPAHIRLHWALDRWSAVLATKSLAEIATILRDTSEESRPLRETCPFSRQSVSPKS